MLCLSTEENDFLNRLYLLVKLLIGNNRNPNQDWLIELNLTVYIAKKVYFSTVHDLE